MIYWQEVSGSVDGANKSSLILPYIGGVDSFVEQLQTEEKDNCFGNAAHVFLLLFFPLFSLHAPPNP